jgi:hypothetical protein
VLSLPESPPSSLPQAAMTNADAVATARSLPLRRVVFTYVSS